jgi:hypothetical protein
MAVSLKFKEEDEKEELLKFLKDGVGDFELPEYLHVPKGKRATSDRARVLMLGGLAHFKMLYQKKKLTNHITFSSEIREPENSCLQNCEQEAGE